MLRWSRPHALGLTAAAALMALSLSAPSAHAQAHPKLRMGTPVNAATTAADPTWSGRGPFKAFSFDGAAGQRVAIAVDSSSFDAYATVGRIMNGIFDPLKFDDDSGEGSNARILFTLPVKGTYVVIAQSLGRTVGPFTITVTALPAPKPVVPRPLALGGQAEATLTETDATDERERHYHHWTFTGRAGAAVVAEMRSTALDSYLIIGRARDGGLEVLGLDDDGGEGYNARLRVVLPEAGEYVIQASGQQGRVGPYSISLSELVVPPPPTPRPIAVGSRTEAALAASDAFDANEQRYHLWSFAGRAGDIRVIEMRSPALDSFLELGVMRGGELVTLANDDDGGGGNDARIRFTLPEDGEYVIKTRALGPALGPYTLALSAFVLPKPPTPRPIGATGSVEATLEATDAFDEEDRRYHLWTVSGRAGELVVIDMQSTAFDSLLTLGRLSGGSLEVLAMDDDGGEGYNARLRYTLPADGEYVVKASALSQGLGSYALSVKTLASPAAAPARPITLGQSVKGSLAPTDAFDDEERHYHLWALSARAGVTLVIEMRSTDVDSRLALGLTRGDRINLLAMDDDGGDGNDSRLRVTIPSDGDYVIRASAMPREVGAYTLSVAELVVPKPAKPRPIALGRTVNDTLTLDDAFDALERHYQLWTFSGRAGESVVIDMGSSQFDALVVIGRMRGDELEQLAMDDDGGDGNNARLRFTLPDDGAYVIQATAMPRRVGAYTLAVNRLTLPRPPAPRRIAFGGTVEAQLTAKDAFDIRDRHYHQYTFSGRAGDTVVIDMRSPTVDSYLALGRVGGAEFTALATDDDGGSGNDSRLRVVLPEDGEYLIRATTMPPKQVGPYTLALRQLVIPRPPTPRPIEVGGRVEAALTATDAFDVHENYYQPWTFTGKAGDYVLITMRSTAIDSVLVLGRMRGDELLEVTNNDDFGEGNDARIRVVLPEDGAYVIRAIALGSQVGPYALSMEALPPRPPPSPIQAGQVVGGALTEGAPQLTDGTFHVDYLYTGRFRERIVVTLASSDFDAYLTVGRLNGVVFEVLGHDDDSAGGTDARVDVTLPEDGTYIIRANSVSRATGAFTVQVESP